LFEYAPELKLLLKLLLILLLLLIIWSCVRFCSSEESGRAALAGGIEEEIEGLIIGELNNSGEVEEGVEEAIEAEEEKEEEEEEEGPRGDGEDKENPWENKSLWLDMGEAELEAGEGKTTEEAGEEAEEEEDGENKLDKEDDELDAGEMGVDKDIAGE
jgi:hypothetical protein